MLDLSKLREGDTFCSNIPAESYTVMSNPTADDITCLQVKGFTIHFFPCIMKGWHRTWPQLTLEEW